MIPPERAPRLWLNPSITTVAHPCIHDTLQMSIHHNSYLLIDSTIIVIIRRRACTTSTIRYAARRCNRAIMEEELVVTRVLHSTATKLKGKNQEYTIYNYRGGGGGKEIQTISLAETLPLLEWIIPCSLTGVAPAIFKWSGL